MKKFEIPLVAKCLFAYEHETCLYFTVVKVNT